MRIANDKTKVFLAIGIVLFSSIGFISLEIFLRVFFPPPLQVEVRHIRQPGEMDEKKMLSRGGQLFMVTETGRRLRPNSVAILTNHVSRNKKIVIRTNSLGYRNPEIKAKTKPRVLFLGDSITFADTVNEENTFVRRVEVLAETRSFPLETINAGIGAVGLETYWNILLETGLSVKPDLVVVGLYLNDFQSSRMVPLFQPPRFLQWSWTVNYLLYVFSKQLTNFTQDKDAWDDHMPRIPKKTLSEWVRFVDCCFEQLEQAGSHHSDFKDLIKIHIHDWGGAWSEGAWNKMKSVLKKMHEKLKEENIRLGVLLFPVRQQVELEWVLNFPQRRAATIAQELGIPILDMLPYLREEWNDRKKPLFFDHCHYTPYGHKILSVEITQFVIDLLKRGTKPIPSSSERAA